MMYVLAGGGEEVATIAVAGGLCIAVLSIIASTIRNISETRQREQTRREVAAYIAEGTMTPEQAQMVLGDSGKSGRKC